MRLEITAQTEFAAAFMCSIAPRSPDDEPSNYDVAFVAARTSAIHVMPNESSMCIFNKNSGAINAREVSPEDCCFALIQRTGDALLHEMDVSS